MFDATQYFSGPPGVYGMLMHVSNLLGYLPVACTLPTSCMYPSTMRASDFAAHLFFVSFCESVFCNLSTSFAHPQAPTNIVQLSFFCLQESFCSSEGVI